MQCLFLKHVLCCLGSPSTEQWSEAKPLVFKIKSKKGEKMGGRKVICGTAKYRDGVNWYGERKHRQAGKGPSK